MPLPFPSKQPTSQHNIHPKNNPKMKHCFFITFTIFLLHSTTQTLAQPSPSPTSPTAAAPSPPGPLNVTAILEKAGQYGTFIRLLQSTQVADQINTQLNNSNQGLTILAPTDNAFSNLRPGILNSLTDEQKASLIQFHVVPSLLSTSQFQTVSNPIRTQAGNTNNGQYPLNITTTAKSVNISTGIVNTTVANSVYSDSQLAVYQVDSVLLPLALFGPKPPAPAPAPAPAKPKKRSESSSTVADAPSTDDSGATGVMNWRAKVVGWFWVAVAWGLVF